MLVSLSAQFFHLSALLVEKWESYKLAIQLAILSDINLDLH